MNIGNAALIAINAAVCAAKVRQKDRNNHIYKIQDLDPGIQFVYCDKLLKEFMNFTLLQKIQFITSFACFQSTYAPIKLFRSDLAACCSASFLLLPTPFALSSFPIYTITAKPSFVFLENLYLGSVPHFF